jgi:acyl dehydratase
MRTVNGLDELKELVGQEIGVSDWHRVTQEEINLFADATHDHQWIHVDPERCKRESPFGAPIAHGYYTLSLAPALLAQILRVQGVRMGVNYGLNKMRLPSPLPVGSRVRLRATVNAFEPFPGGASGTIGLTFEVEGQQKPTCVAEAIYRYYV